MEDSRSVAMLCCNGADKGFTVEVYEPDGDGDMGVVVYKDNKPLADFWVDPVVLRRLARIILELSE